MASSQQGQSLVSCSMAVPHGLVDHAAGSSRWKRSLVNGSALEEGLIIANAAVAYEHAFAEAAMRHMGNGPPTHLHRVMPVLHQMAPQSVQTNITIAFHQALPITTYTCVFKPGCLTSHNWLHTQDCKASNGKSELRTCEQIAVAVALLSPVTTMRRMPAALHRFMAPLTSFLGGSCMPTSPIHVSSDSSSLLICSNVTTIKCTK